MQYTDNDREKIYSEAIEKMKAAKTEVEYRAVGDVFHSIAGYCDADSLSTHCFLKGDECHKASLLELGDSLKKQYTEEALKKAIEVYREIPDDRAVAGCQRLLEQFHTDNTSRACQEYNALPKKNSSPYIKIILWSILAIGLIFLIESVIPKSNWAFFAVLKKNRLFEIVSPVASSAIGAITFLIVLIKFIIPNCKYKSAVRKMGRGEYRDACNLFCKLVSKHSNELVDRQGLKKARECIFLSQKEALLNARKGDIVRFGYYKEYCFKTGEEYYKSRWFREEMEWKVLVVEKDKVLLISEYGMEGKSDFAHSPKHWREVSYEDNCIRKWLNIDFFNDAFDDSHKEMIMASWVSPDRNPDYIDKDMGNGTNDRVFILSILEAERYFTSDKDRQAGCVDCQYSLSRSEEPHYWILRTEGKYKSDTSFICRSGEISYAGDHWFSESIVRPAIWVNIAPNS